VQVAIHKVESIRERHIHCCFVFIANGSYG